jgi:hypothetical protein
MPHAEEEPDRSRDRSERRPVMSTAEAFWMSVGASGRLVELSRDECLGAARGHVGGSDRVHHR